MELAIVSDVSFHRIRKVRAPLLRAHLGQIDANETKCFGQLVIIRQIVKCGHDEALREVPGCTKDYHSAGRRHGDARGLLRSWSGTAIWPI